MSRIAMTLGHPLRVRIVVALGADAGSATTLSRQFGDVSVGDVSYHLRVLYRQCKVIEPARQRRVRGARETFYRLKPLSRFGNVWAKVPQPVLNGFRSAWFQQFIDASMAALGSGSLDRDDTTFIALPVTVDQQGWREVDTAMKEAAKRVERAEVGSRRRLHETGSGSAISALIGLAAFEVARPSRDEG